MGQPKFIALANKKLKIWISRKNCQNFEMKAESILEA